MKIATLKKPIVVQIPNPLSHGRVVNILVKVIKYSESLGTMLMGTDVAWMDDGQVQWYRGYYGLSDVEGVTVFRIDTPFSNIEGTQEI